GGADRAIGWRIVFGRERSAWSAGARGQLRPERRGRPGFGIGKQRRFLSADRYDLPLRTQGFRRVAGHLPVADRTHGSGRLFERLDAGRYRRGRDFVLREYSRRERDRGQLRQHFRELDFGELDFGQLDFVKRYGYG